MGYQFTVPPSVEPVSIQEAKNHLRVDFDDDDAYIQGLIRVARWKLERQYRRAFMTQTLVLGLDYFGTPERTRDTMYPVSFWPPAGYQYPINSVIELRPPVQSITSIQYYDPSGTLQTFSAANYILDVTVEPNRVAPKLTQQWPAVGALPGAVIITFVAGHTDPRLVPDNIKQAMYLVISNFYENREEVVIGTRLVTLQLPDGVAQLMAPYRFPLVR